MHVKEANSLPATRFPLRAWPCPQVPREIHLDTTAGGPRAATASYSGIFVRSVVLFPAATGVHIANIDVSYGRGMWPLFY